MDDLFEDSPFKKDDEEESVEDEPDRSSNGQVGVDFGFPTEGDGVEGAVGGEQLDDVVEEDEENVDDVGVSKPALPRDDIKVSVQSYQKTADDYVFDVEVEVNGHSKLVQRNYKDLQWLHRNLSRRMELGGYILPPMPAPPPKALEPTVVILGESSKAMFGDATRLPCLLVELFMQSLADHRFFSENDTVHTYVAKEELTERDKLGTGTLWNSFTKAISDYRLGGVEEPDEDFHKFLQYMEDLAPLLLDTSQTFSKLVSSQQSLACSQMVIAGMLRDLSTIDTFKNEASSSSFNKLAEAKEEEKQCLYSKSLDGRHTMGMTFDLYHRYCLQAKEMLYRRLSKLQKLLTCTSKLDKAKPEKKQEAEAAKDQAEREFQDISDTARKEIDLFKQKYVKFFQNNLISFAESQLSHSRIALENLTKVRDQLLLVGKA